MNYLELFKNHFYKMGESYFGLKISGPDSKRFLNGQLTNDVGALNKGEFQVQSRLDRNGRLQSYFYLLSQGDYYLALVPSQLINILKDDLEKYIIMDDVEMVVIEADYDLIFSPKKECQSILDPDEIIESYKGMIGFLPAFFVKAKIPKSWKKISGEEFEKFSLLQGEPVFGLTAVPNTLVTDSILNLTGVSLTKGCFLGQETVSKIETRRGGAYFPVALELDNFDEANSSIENKDIFLENKKAGKVIRCIWENGFKLLIVQLFRDYRVEGRTFSFTMEGNALKGTVRNLPYHGEYNQKQYLEEKFEAAVKLFQSEDTNKSMDLLSEIIEIDSSHENALESLGVILGRLERFEEGLELMDQVLLANPDSVMAHTNKSLFLMRLGKIEEAEEEKAQATVKSFSMFGKDAQNKKLKEEALEKEKAELHRRKEMFEQVLEIDPDDEIAKYGLADVLLKENNPKDSIPLLVSLLAINPRYSMAYLLLGKCYLAINDFQNAKEVFEKGVMIASKQGEMMPANEMQAKLLALQ